MKSKILNDISQAWNNLDAGLIFKHLCESLTFDSLWADETMNKEKFCEYISKIFHTLKTRKMQITASIVDDPYCGGEMVKVCQGANISYFRILIENQRIIKADMRAF